jgi:hypothetical protein
MCWSVVMLKAQPVLQLEAQLQSVLVEKSPINYSIVTDRPVGLTNRNVY